MSEPLPMPASASSKGLLPSLTSSELGETKLGYWQSHVIAVHPHKVVYHSHRLIRLVRAQSHAGCCVSVCH